MKKKHLKKLFKKLLKLGFVSALVMVVGAMLAVAFALFRRRGRFDRRTHHGYDSRRFARPRRWESRVYR